MKIFQTLLITGICLFFISCQKELGFNNGPDSAGTLKADISGNCLPAIVNGIYRADSSLRENNFIELQVNATTKGHYLILSDTVNGYSFRGEGTIVNLGLNTLRIYGQGRPAVAGLDTFRINYGTSFCDISVSVIPANTSVSVFTLGGAPGGCTGFTSQGTYQIGVPLIIANTVQMNVDVTVLGTYQIVVPSTNGMSFIKEGVFTTLGLQSVTLSGTGTPNTVGANNLNVSNTSGTCTFTLTVLPAGAGSTAVYTLQSTAGVCNGAVANGTYTSGVALTPLNNVVVNVDVTTIGTYNISTTVVNGMSFSKSGTFTTTGVQPVILVGSGIPVGSGISNLTASTGTSNCTFSVTVAPGAPNLDYLPQTSYSNWTYKTQGGTPDDTFHLRVLPNSIVRNAITYKIFEKIEPAVENDSTLYRAVNGKYYMLYNMSLGFDNNFNTDGLILDSSLAVNATWNVFLGNNTINGVPMTASYTAEILAKSATAVYNAVTYNNVIKVKSKYYYNIGAGNVAYLEEETWYAKGYGIIYTKVNDLPVTTSEVYEIQRTQVY